MKSSFVGVALVGLACLALVLVFTTPMQADDELQKIYDKALLPTQDQPGLPRVLLIGDSISLYYTQDTRDRLKGRANVHHIPANGSNTDFGLKHLDQWLGTEKWDVIHFNWGLHDIVVRPDGEHAVPLPLYEQNLRAIVKRLKQTGAQLVWASTTPVPAHIEGDRRRNNDDVLAYNGAALAVMHENHILINDLYVAVADRLPELQRPNDVHFNIKRSDLLSQEVADFIMVGLAVKPVHDQPGLPRVLLIGDSISVGYTPEVRKLLQGKANVHRVPWGDWRYSTADGLKLTDVWLGHEKWDVIHFNIGLHDLAINADGQYVVPLPQYATNLREFVRRLKLTGAKLIWATTTPVPSHVDTPHRETRDAIAYNEAALPIMKDNNIPIDDLYHFILPRVNTLQIPDNVHFTFEGSDALAGQVAQSILSVLGQK